MHVKISNIEFDVENTLAGVAEMFVRIDEAMGEFQVYFSHLVADGIEVTDSPQQYVEQNLPHLAEIEVVFFTTAEYAGQVVAIMGTFLERAVPTIRDVAKEFYGKPDDGTWERFSLAMNGFQNIIHIINTIIADAAFASCAGEFSAIGNKLQGELLTLNEAIENNDMPLVGDIVTYELVPIIGSLESAVRNMADSYSVARDNN